MNKRIMSIVLVLVLMLSLATTVFAEVATEEVYVDSVDYGGGEGILTIPNVSKVEKITFNEKEISEYIRDTKYLDDVKFWVTAEGGYYDDIVNNNTKIDNGHYLISLRDAISYENMLGGVPVYHVDEGPVVITSERALGGMRFFWLDDAIETSYVGKYHDADEFHEKFYSSEYSSINVYETTPENWVLAAGTTAGLTESGKYLFMVGDAYQNTTKVFAVHVGGTPAPAQPKPKATPTASTVLVNNVSTNFEAYTIEGNNYFKLRDLAQVVNNTEKNFEVEWDGAKNAINLKSNTLYTPAGGELAKGDNTAKNAKPTTSKIYKDGVELSLTAYTIGGNNFFKLRDIAQAFNIGVTWDNATKTIGIDTSIGYVVE